MSVTLLLDLDDTLLDNPIEEFLPVYASKLARHMAPYVDPKLFIQALNAGTERMVVSEQPVCTLKEVFESVFYPTLKRRHEELEPALDQFYAEVFPTLKELTRPVPAAEALVETAFERGYRVAISTHPVFPLTATLQRLEWAGLPVEKYPFAVVGSFETFHFAKPNPAFYAEVMARMGWPEDPVIVVGDNLINDIRGAQELGMPTFWIRPPSLLDEVDLREPISRYELSELIPWLDKTPSEELQPNYQAPSALMAILRSTLGVLCTLCADLEPERWSARPQPDEWSPAEILCHLRDVDAEINLPRLTRIMSENNPFIPGVDSDRWAIERNYFHQDGSAALGRFSRTRQEIVNQLIRQAPKDWERTARHAIFGPTQLRELVGIMAGHDQVHVRQMVKTLAMQHSSDGGSFKN
jgi:FMN phosphatase YigB (HAD superfamily)